MTKVHKNRVLDVPLLLFCGTTRRRWFCASVFDCELLIPIKSRRPPPDCLLACETHVNARELKICHPLRALQVVTQLHYC